MLSSGIRIDKENMVALTIALWAMLPSIVFGLFYNRVDLFFVLGIWILFLVVMLAWGVEKFSCKNYNYKKERIGGEQK